MKEIRPLRVRKIYSDGQHNAFTSITAFGDDIFLAFRSGTTHIAFDGKIRILRSSDRGENWETSALIGMDGCDLRDPKLIEFDGKLHLYTFSRQPGGIFASWHYVSKDGKEFGRAEKIDTVPLIWGLAKFGDKLYCTGYRRVSEANSAAMLYASPDGSRWEQLLQFPFFGTETAIDFDPAGYLYAFVRDSTYGCGCIPTVCRLEPPYTRMPELNRQTMDLVRALPLRMVGPMLKRFNGASLLVGRCWDGGITVKRNIRTEVYILEDHDDPRHCFVLPSGGDTSYASYLELRPGRALLSYYSSHEHKTALPLDETAEKVPAAEHSTAADIFLADLSHNYF